MSDKSLMEAMTELEKAVSVAKTKQSEMEKLDQQLRFAQNAYTDAVNTVNQLRASLNDRLGNIFPDQNARVKVS